MCFNGFFDLVGGKQYCTAKSPAVCPQSASVRQSSPVRGVKHAAGRLYSQINRSYKYNSAAELFILINVWVFFLIKVDFLCESLLCRLSVTEMNAALWRPLILPVCHFHKNTKDTGDESTAGVGILFNSWLPAGERTETLVNMFHPRQQSWSGGPQEQKEALIYNANKTDFISITNEENASFLVISLFFMLKYWSLSENPTLVLHPIP